MEYDIEEIILEKFSEYISKEKIKMESLNNVIDNFIDWIFALTDTELDMDYNQIRLILKKHPSVKFHYMDDEVYVSVNDDLNL